MPAPPISDLGTGFNSQETIKKLMEYERQPLYRLERENNEILGDIAAWEKLRNLTRELADKSRDLTSIAGSFSKRILFTSDPETINGIALAGSKLIKRKLQVEQLATSHEFHSEPLEVEKNIGKGSFSIIQNGKEKIINYNGGNVKDFIGFLTNEVKEFADVNITDAGENKIVIKLESKRSGKEGEIEFKDPNNILANAVLVTNKRIITPIIFTQSDLTIVGDNPKMSFSVLKEGKTLRFKEGSLNLDLKEYYKSKKEAILNLQLFTKKAKTIIISKENQKKETIDPGPNISVVVGDVKLRAPSLTRSRTINIDSNDNESNIAKTEIILNYEYNGNKYKKNFLVKLEVGYNKNWKIPLDSVEEGAIIKAISFNTNGEVEVSNLNFESPRDIRPLNETVPAKDAIVKLDGIRVHRSRNNELRDLVVGAELNLKKVSNKNIEISIKADDDQLLKDIKEWVKIYNNLHTYIRETTNVNINNKNDKNRKEQQSIGGVFTGNITVLQLKYQTSTVIASMYPVANSNGFKILPDIGISTGRLGAKWSEIQNGLLEVEDKKLLTAITDRPEGVQNLFASNFNSKKIIDNGVAFKMAELLKPYAQINQGFISSQVDLLKNKINSNKENISKRQVILERKQDNLRERFGRMERSIRQSRNTSDYLKRAYDQPKGQE